MYELAIGPGAKHRRFTEIHCAWVGGVVLADMNCQSETVGWKVAAEAARFAEPKVIPLNRMATRATILTTCFIRCSLCLLISTDKRQVILR